MSPAAKFGAFALGVLLISLVPIVLLVSGVDDSAVPAVFGAAGVLIGVYLAGLAYKGRGTSEADISRRGNGRNGY